MTTLKQTALHHIDTADLMAPSAAMRSSAELGVNEARTAWGDAHYVSALYWAQRSLSYSVGKFSPTWEAAYHAWVDAQEAQAAYIEAIR